MPPDINAVIVALNAPPLPFVPEQYHFAPGYALVLTGFGLTPEHARLVTQIRQTLPPLFDLVTPMPYVVLQQLLDEANAWGQHSYDKATYVESLSDEVIDVVTEQVPAEELTDVGLFFYRLDGAYSRVGDDDTAFGGGRSPRYGVFIVGLAPDADLLAADRRWVRDFWAALRPHAIGSGDGYVNGSTDFQTRTRSATATGRPSSTGWPRSRLSTTRTTRSTSTPTSRRPDAGLGRSPFPFRCGGARSVRSCSARRPRHTARPSRPAWRQCHNGRPAPRPDRVRRSGRPRTPR